MDFFSFLFTHVLVYIGLFLAFYAAIDISCVLVFERHLFRSKFLSEPTWKEVFHRIKEKR